MRRAVMVVAAVLSLGASSAWAQNAAPETNTSTAATEGLMDTGTHVRKSMLSAWVSLPYYYGFGIGIGARYTLPLLHDGFVPTLNDSVELEFGADIATYGFVFNELRIPVAARWTFHGVVPKLDLYAKLGVGIGIAFGNAFYNAVYPFIETHGGLLYWLSDNMALRVELGYPDMHVGLGWNF